MTREKRIKLVREAIRNATENGYDVGGPSRKLARDMIKYDADLEDETVENVAEAIVQVRIDDNDPFAAERDRWDPEENPELRDHFPFDD